MRRVSSGSPLLRFVWLAHKPTTTTSVLSQGAFSSCIQQQQHSFSSCSIRTQQYNFEEEEEAKLPPTNIIQDSFPVAKSHLKERYMQPPKLDRHGNPVWDYTKMKAFDKSKYPAIESPFLTIPKKKRHEWKVRDYDEKMTVEFRCGVKSDDFMACGLTPLESPLGSSSEATKFVLPVSESSVEQVKKIFSFSTASKPEMNKQKKQAQILRFQKSPRDTGSAPVQIAVLTERIKALTEHLKTNHKDYTSARKLQVIVNRRKRMMRYLKKTNPDIYWETIRNLDMKISLVD
ncbi:hypothetical protein C9374_007897 [Naegleria lovaniensis]|uniref:Ribosomal protein S15 n=1 Tax=Naegleria lovaniensis TaxID=51637 RepID=A0AA88KLC7_NAELO|nr:uncharacterized protein C9374_007897 [Naegleria lovaniensis]KAG2378749.1 hypothetical protein C9374_007897 [Naegleria lovaniensis]